MRICAAQVRSAAGDVAANTKKHLELIQRAAAQQADVVFFPELSLTGYEPRLAKSLALHPFDPRLDVFQEASNAKTIIIGVGLPLAVANGVQIGMLWFAPGAPPRTYAKQQLHQDELPFFVPGERQVVVEVAGCRLAPAICYESLQPSHAAEAARLGTSVYVASVAKSARGVAKAMTHYPAIAQRHDMSVIMANCVGPSDDFIGVGQSGVWNRRGELLARLSEAEEGFATLEAEGHRSDNRPRKGSSSSA